MISAIINYLFSFARVMAVASIAWISGQWLCYFFPRFPLEVSIRFRRISLAIIQSILPPQKPLHKRPSVIIGGIVVIAITVFIVHKVAKNAAK